VGVVGCGDISQTYLEVLPRFDAVEVVACADLIPERARGRAEQFAIPRACSVDELLGDPSVEIVLNLTVPRAHAEISRAALEAGKHVYSEKPLAIDREEGRAVIELARAKNLRVGVAPDTFLGGGLQTARKLIDDGLIGRPRAAATFMMDIGYEEWHPSAEFFYQPGAGPMFDRGPYNLTALIFLFGPVERVTAAVHTDPEPRFMGIGPRAGQRIEITTPTHVAGIMEFANGVIATITTSFEAWGRTVPQIEIYGTSGTLRLGDPNYFDGFARFHNTTDFGTWTEQPFTHGHTDESRGLGLADMATAIHEGRPHRANGDLGFHVLDVMTSFLEAAERGTHVVIESTVNRPEPMLASAECGS
jgi:predicted dehydrogenase